MAIISVILYSDPFPYNVLEHCTKYWHANKSLTELKEKIQYMCSTSFMLFLRIQKSMGNAVKKEKKLKMLG